MVSEERIRKAVVTFLNNQRMEVVDEHWHYAPYGYEGVVAKESDGQLVFVIISARTLEDGGLPEDNALKQKRGEVEVFAGMWLATCPSCLTSMRFDEIALLVTNDNQAMLRHHTNCLN